MRDPATRSDQHAGQLRRRYMHDTARTFDRNRIVGTAEQGVLNIEERDPLPSANELGRTRWSRAGEAHAREEGASVISPHPYALAGPKPSTRRRRKSPASVTLRVPSKAAVLTVTVRPFLGNVHTLRSTTSAVQLADSPMVKPHAWARETSHSRCCATVTWPTRLPRGRPPLGARSPICTLRTGFARSRKLNSRPSWTASSTGVYFRACHGGSASCQP